MQDLTLKDLFEISKQHISVLPDKSIEVSTAGQRIEIKPNIEHKDIYLFLPKRYCKLAVNETVLSEIKDTKKDITHVIPIRDFVRIRIGDETAFDLLAKDREDFHKHNIRVDVIKNTIIVSFCEAI